MKNRRVSLSAAEKGIVRLLQEDGRMTTVEIARRLEISEPTVRKKLGQMLADGTIRIRAVADPFDLGYEASAFIGIDVERAALLKVASVLEAYPFVDSVAIATGPHDLIVKACFPTIRELHDFLLVELGAVEGIKDSHSFLILKTQKTDGLIGVADMQPDA